MGNKLKRGLSWVEHINITNLSLNNLVTQQEILSYRNTIQTPETRITGFSISQFQILTNLKIALPVKTCGPYIVKYFSISLLLKMQKN